MRTEKPLARLTLWDSPDDPPCDGSIVYRWSGHRESDGTHSLLQYVEANADRLRARYLAWIHDLGEARPLGPKRERLIDLLRRDGASYWWMTTLAEQSPLKSPGILDALRLLAFEEIVNERRPETLQLVSANAALDATLNAFCGATGIAYSRDRPGRAHAPLTAQASYRQLPYWVRAIVTGIRDVARRWPLRHAARVGWPEGERSACFFSYFLNVDSAAKDNGIFRSHYWEHLPAMMQANGFRITWIHHFIESGAVLSPTAALHSTKAFNARRDREGFHTFIDAYLSLGVLRRVVAGWFWLMMRSIRLRAVKRAFTPAGSRLSLWPVLGGDWLDSMRGPTSILNLILIELFNEALRRLPRQAVGIYLYENQAWERAMIHAWRRYGHGRLIAVAHSTTRFWDLRYFADPRSRSDSAIEPLPRADVLALNGKAQLEAYGNLGAPHGRVVEAEALRFGHLRGRPLAAAGGRAAGAPVRVLVLGDYSPVETDRLLNLVRQVRDRLGAAASFTLKPHPSYGIDERDRGGIGLSVVRQPLDQILSDYDVALSSNSTSAAVDVYLAGLPLVVMLDDTQLNFSPLRGRSDVRFVSTFEELAVELSNHDLAACEAGGRDDFFFLDPALPRWKELLGIDASPAA